MKNLEIYEGNWTVDIVMNNPDKIWVFGDNDQRYGKLGQSIIRDCPNVIGLRTKKSPNNKITSFYNDSEFELNKKKIFDDIMIIKNLINSNKTVVFSNGGYGNGLSKMNQHAPKTFEYLNIILKENFHFDNLTGKRWSKIPSHEEMDKAIEIKVDYDPLLFDTFPSIKSGLITAITREDEYKIGQVVKFTNSGTKEFLICRVVVDSYPYGYIDDELWFKLEGINKTDESFDDKYQFQFQYICSVYNGVMKFKEGIFNYN